MIFNKALVMSVVHQLTTVFCAVGSLFIVKPSDMLTAKPGAVMKVFYICYNTHKKTFDNSKVPQLKNFSLFDDS